jgi:REP element-mobilizing transposase RayT
MSNHVHWVFNVFKNEMKNKSGFLQDILQSVKWSSANEINKNEGLKGSLWQKESFDITIRDDVHLYNAINYTINNPVKAGLV